MTALRANPQSLQPLRRAARVRSETMQIGRVARLEAGGDQTGLAAEMASCDCVMDKIPATRQCLTGPGMKIDRKSHAVGDGGER
ncbi:hypothetical protein [Ochrobactrum quorumnocens]|uniref:hypothetical protein n=1 Tax=Ochrobactrum quorumnocens TaxID=271865 RepID=UPI003BA31075